MTGTDRLPHLEKARRMAAHARAPAHAAAHAASSSSSSIRVGASARRHATVVGCDGGPAIALGTGSMDDATTVLFAGPLGSPLSAACER